MKQGIIFTKDKTEIDVFFLKEQVPPEIDAQPSPKELDKAPSYYNDLNLLSEQDIAKNSVEEKHDYSITEHGTKGCCPVGHEGEKGWKGYDSLYDVILETVRTFRDSELNIASETAQEILAMSIERKVNCYYDKK